MANTIETGLRRAVAKGNASGPEDRLRIYEAAERAILRVAEEKDLPSETVERQREALRAAVEAIEAEYPHDPPRPEKPGEASAGEAAPPEAEIEAEADAPSAEIEAETGAPPRDGVATTEAIDATYADDGRPPPIPPAEHSQHGALGIEGMKPPGPRDRTARRSRSGGRSLSGWLPLGGLALVVVALVGLVAYASLPTTEPPAEAASESAERPTIADVIREDAGGGEVASAGAANGADPETTGGIGEPDGGEIAWIEVFDGSRLSVIGARGGGRIETIQRDGGSGVRLTAAVPDETGDQPAEARQGGEAAEAGGGEGASSGFDVELGPGLLDRLRGETVRMELTVGTPDGEPRAFALQCLVAGESVCNRRRFSATRAVETMLFETAIPGDAGEAGRLRLDPSVGASGSIDLFGLRVGVV